MKTLAILAGLAASGFVPQALSANDMSAGQFQFAKLAVPGVSSPLRLYDSPDKYDDLDVCKSKGTMLFYPARSGSVSAAVAWYATHLPGFTYTHTMDSGRSQDTFYNATGTLTVSITGEPGNEGQDTKVYSVIYLAIQPGVSGTLIEGLSREKVDCQEQTHPKVVNHFPYGQT